jgi:ABC-type phosphate transport system permease subunit
MATNFQETPLTMKNRSEIDKNVDWSFIWLTRIFALAITGILLWIALQITIAAWPAIQKFGINFLFTSNWNPVNDALISLPSSLRQAALAVGATRWETIFQVIIPAAFSGIASAVMLALGRAMGETMAVTMLIGNANNINISLLAPSNTISSLLASQFAEANGLQVAALMYAALVLFVLTMIVNILAEFIVARVQ